jgi:hypothetical protein
LIWQESVIFVNMLPEMAPEARDAGHPLLPFRCVARGVTSCCTHVNVHNPAHPGRILANYVTGHTVKEVAEHLEGYPDRAVSRAARTCGDLSEDGAADRKDIQHGPADVAQSADAARSLGGEPEEDQGEADCEGRGLGCTEGLNWEGLNWRTVESLARPGSHDWHLHMKPYPKYLDWLRYFSAYLLFTYGVSKLAGVQFTLSPDIARRPIGSLSGFQLTWYYFSYSHVYASLLGLTQLTGGALLLFRKTALLGAAVMTPVMANILMINLFFHIAAGAEFMAVFLFLSMLLLLWREREALLNLFWKEQHADAPASRKFHRSMAALVVLIIIAQMVFVWWMER